MTTSAEDVIRARNSDEVPLPPKFESVYKEILQTTIPAVILSLREKGWPGGEIATVAILNSAISTNHVEEKALWKLTTHMYLTSRGHIAIKVLDPLKGLKYEYAEVELEYLIKNHSMKTTQTLLKNELAKLASIDGR